MKRGDLRRMIQQEIARVEEDLLVSPGEVPDDFKRLTGLDYSDDICPTCGESPCSCNHDQEDYHDSEVCPHCGKSPCECPGQQRMKLSCDACGGPLVMESGCGCGSTTSEYKDYEPELVYPSGIFGMEDDFSFNKPEEHHKGGAYMSKAQLHKIKEYAEELQDMIPDGHDLDDWMRSHISQAADDIAEVYHKLEYTHSKD